jgi:hypothetical protein
MVQTVKLKAGRERLNSQVMGHKLNIFRAPIERNP